MIPSITYLPPIIITAGGTYSGNWRSTDGSPAILISTSEPVEIKNSVIVGNGETIVMMYGYTVTNIHHNDIYGDTPYQSDKAWGRAVNNYKPRSFVFENNYMEHTGGMIVDHLDEFFPDKIHIRYNQGLNCDKRLGNGNPGDHKAWILVMAVKELADVEIAWNEFINNPNESLVEDNINIYNSRGLVNSPIRVHDNFIRGAYLVPATATGFTGSGITVDGVGAEGNTYETTPAYIEAYNNQVLQCCNACMNIAIGHDVKFYNNRMLHSGHLPDGITYLPASWAGCCIFNGSSLPLTIFRDNSIINNVIGYVRQGINYKFTDRQDEMNDRTVNFMSPDLNTYIANPITQAVIDNEWTIWQNKLATNSIVIGNAIGAPPDIIAPTSPTNLVATNVAQTTLTVGWSASTDNIGVTGYEIFKGGVSIGTTSSLSYDVTGLTANTLYTFTVKAKDATNNVSAPSSGLSVTTESIPVSTGVSVYKSSTNKILVNNGKLLVINQRQGILQYSPFNDIVETVAQWGQQQSAKSSDLTISTLFSRMGGKSLRVEINSDSPYNERYRSELNKGSTDPDNAWEHWFAFSLYLPTEWEFDPEYEVLWQLHDTADPTEGSKSPPFSLRCESDTFFARIYYSSDPLQDDANTFTVKLPIGNIVRGEWIDWVMYCKMSWLGDGIFRVWRNREKVVERFGPNCYNDTLPPYHKLGIYKPPWADTPNVSTTTQRICYYDEYRLGSSTSSFRDVDPEGRSPLS